MNFKTTLMTGIVMSLGLALSQTGFAKEVSHFGGGMTLTVPDSYVMLTQAQIDAKFARSGGMKPTIVYARTADRHAITIALSEKTGVSLPPMNDQFAQAFRNQMDNSVTVLTWHSSGVKAINGNQIMVLDFETAAAESTDYNIRNTMIAHYDDGTFSLINANCTTNYSEECTKVTAAVLQSLRFK